MIPLTPDIVARAIIAAAGVYGDDPVIACTTRSRRYRRPLKAAALGLYAAVGGDLVRYARILGVQDKSLYHTRRTAGPDAVLWRAAQMAEFVVAATRGADAPTDPVTPLKPIPSFGLIDAVAILEPRLAEITKAYPEGATVAQIEAMTGLEARWVPHAASKLYELHKCRWTRTPTSKGKKVLLRWGKAPPEKVSSKAGRISGSEFTQAIAPKPPVAHGSIKGCILASLPANPRSLAILCDAKELAVDECLSALARDGLVIPDPMPAEGRRSQTWRLKQERAA